MLESLKRCKRDLLLRRLIKYNVGLNIVEFSKTATILDAILMSDKSWREIDASTIAKSWSKLVSVPEILECEQTAPNEERSECQNFSLKSLKLAEVYTTQPKVFVHPDDSHTICINRIYFWSQ